MYFRRIADLRTDHDKTQQEIANVLHCNRQVYARYERGLREIPVSMLIQLAEYYDVDLNYLCGISQIKNEFPKK